MARAIDLARRAYHFARRASGKESIDENPFPIDAWTDSRYHEWFLATRCSQEELSRQRAASEGFQDKPTFSFIVPLYKTPLPYLKTMAESVLGQTYGNLELVLVNASPELTELKGAIAKLASFDERVKVIDLAGNLGITENTNAGIAAATGDFCCFLDHDDFIEPDLLFEYAKAINEQPDIDVLYCDEDLVEENTDGSFRHLHPLFKPKITPELLLCKNSVVHLMTVRRELIKRMPQPTCVFDGAQDYNMILWCSGAARRVREIQKVLYHWRISEESTAANPDAKPYSQKSYRLAASKELLRRGGTGRIISSGIVNVHNVWFKSTTSQTVSVVVDCEPWAAEPPAAGACPFNTIDRFIEFFEQNNTIEDAEIVLVNAGSARMEFPESFKRVEASADANHLARLNAGVDVATGDYLIFLDAGCFFDTPEPLEQLAAVCTLEGVGVAAPKVLYGNGRNKTYGVAVTAERVMPLYRGYEDDFPGYQCNIRSFQNSSACGLQGLTLSRALFEQLGGFDERFSDELGAVDLCHRIIGQGLRITNLCTVKLRTSDIAPEHCYVCAENAPDYPSSEVTKFDEKWPGARAQGDPYLNRNLDQSSSYFQLGCSRAD